MFNLSTQARSDVSLLSPTVFDLEEAHYEQAKAFIAADDGDEKSQWQTYLNLLGLLSFRDWLAEQTISAQDSGITLSTDGERYIQLGEFRLYVASAEHVLSEQIELHSEAVESPDQAAHFYVVLEVSEEQDEVWFRGFIRYDQLMQVAKREGEAIAAPLSVFESEPSRLLSYCRYLEASAIELPQANPTQISTIQAAESVDRTSISEAIATTRTRLSQWLDNIVDEGWLAWESLQPQVAYATRSLGAGIKCGKLVHLGIEVAENPLALVLTITPEPDEKLSILVQLLPTGRDLILAPNIQLSLISKKGRQLQTVTSYSRDNYIQLKSFKGKVGMRFSLQVQFESTIVTEDFEI